MSCPDGMKTKISVVAPCYNEEGCLPEFVRRCSCVCHDVAGEAYEIILVDDGSSDRTWSIIEQLSQQNANVIGLRMFRNHGHQLAATAGLSVSQGDRVMLIDADLQDPPEAITAMMALMDRGADVVYGQRLSRKGETLFKLVTASLFYRLLGALSPVNIPRDTGDFRLMTRQVVEVLTLMPERHRFLRGMVSWIGGEQVAYAYERNARFAGTTGYPFKKMVRLAVDAITSFSIIPLRIAVWLGITTSLVAFGVLCYALYVKILGQVVPGWASSVATNAFFSGVQLLVLGIIGEYLGRSVEEQKGRPLFTIRSLRARGKEYCLPTDFFLLSTKERQNLLDVISAQKESGHD